MVELVQLGRERVQAQVLEGRRYQLVQQHRPVPPQPPQDLVLESLIELCDRLARKVPLKAVGPRRREEEEHPAPVGDLAEVAFEIAQHHRLLELRDDPRNDARRHEDARAPEDGEAVRVEGPGDDALSSLHPELPQRSLEVLGRRAGKGHDGDPLGLDAPLQQPPDAQTSDGGARPSADGGLQTAGLTASCGGAVFDRLPPDTSAFAPFTSFDKLDLSRIGEEAPFFLREFASSYEWFVTQEGEGWRQVFGQPSRPGVDPPYASLRLEMRDGEWAPVSWGQCRIELDAEGWGNARFVIDPKTPPDPEANRISVLATEVACAGGQAAEDRDVRAVILNEDERAVSIVILVEPTKGATEEQAQGVHRMAAGAFPLFEKVSPKSFLKALALAEIGVGTMLLTPVVPNALAGAALSTFAGGLVTMYLRTPALHEPHSVWPTPAGIGVSKDIWMLAIGLGLLADRHGESDP